MGKQVTVSTQVDDEIRLAAKIKAAKEDKSVAQVIRDLLARWLANGGEEQPDKKKQQKT